MSLERITYDKMVEGKYHEPPTRLGLRLDEIIMDKDLLDPHLRIIRDRVKHDIERSHSLKGKRELILDAISKELLGMTLEDVDDESTRILKPHKKEEERRKRLIISTASENSESWHSERAIELDRGFGVGIPQAIEKRDATGSTEEDCIVMSSPDTEELKEEIKAEIVDISNETIGTTTQGYTTSISEIYNKNHALLIKILQNPNSKKIGQIKEFMQQEDTPVFYPYDMDTAAKILLVWLSREIGMDEIEVAANPPEIADRMTSKGILYPEVNDSLDIHESDDRSSTLRKESQKSELTSITGEVHTEIAGYSVVSGDSSERFEKDIYTALMLHGLRHESPQVVIKPERGTDGGGIRKLDLDRLSSNLAYEIRGLMSQGDYSQAISLYKRHIKESGEANRVIKDVLEEGKSVVVESNVDYFETELKTIYKRNELVTSLRANVSAHVIDGEVQDEIALQFTEGTAWAGNAPVNHEAWEKLVLNNFSELDEDTMTKTLGAHQNIRRNLRDQVHLVAKSSKISGEVVRGGEDYAVGKTGPKNDRRLVISPQDMNIRANGGENSHQEKDRARKVYGDKGQAMTKNFTPKVDYKKMKVGINSAIQRMKQEGIDVYDHQLRLIAVSTGWGQIGIIGDDLEDIIKTSMILEYELRELNLIE